MFSYSVCLSLLMTWEFAPITLASLPAPPKLGLLIAYFEYLEAAPPAALLLRLSVSVIFEFFDDSVARYALPICKGTSSPFSLAAIYYLP